MITALEAKLQTINYILEEQKEDITTIENMIKQKTKTHKFSLYLHKEVFKKEYETVLKNEIYFRALGYEVLSTPCDIVLSWGT